jgi:plasmid stabilization system protein ParE
VAKVVWTERATAWLGDIHAYVSQDNSIAATRTVKAIQEKALLLEKFPELGYKYEETSGRDVRILLYGHYRIAYDINDDGTIRILGVFHAALDIERYLF